MPDDRFIHRRLGHSDKVSALSDFEFRVWTQFILSSDDFGVMRLSATTVQADNDAFAAKGAKMVQRALDRLAIVGLIRTFQHQNRTYCYQHDWQDWQKVRYPSKTIHPCPPADALAECSRDTQWLFSFYPGGGDKLPSWKAPKEWEHSRKIPGKFLEEPREDSRDDSASHAQPLAVSQSLTPFAVRRSPAPPPAQRHGLQTLHRGGHQRHAWCSERICVPDFQHEKFVGAVGGTSADLQLKAFYDQTVAGIPDSQPIESDPLKFWPPLVTARWPPQSASVGTRTAALQRATAEFLRGGAS
jgi:hypothetical protein